MISIPRQRCARIGNSPKCKHAATLILATLLLALNSEMNCSGADIVWTNTAGGNWGTAANWSPNPISGGADNAFITKSGSFTLVVNTRQCLLIYYERL